MLPPSLAGEGWGGGRNAMDSNRLAGKNIIVTGAASGIGKASALRLAAEGAQVAFISNREGTRAIYVERNGKLEQTKRNVSLAESVWKYWAKWVFFLSSS